MRYTAQVHRLFAATALCALVGLGSLPARADTIVEEWATIKTPPPPALQPIAVDPKTTALLVLDLLPRNCGIRPRCVASIPKIAALIKAARTAHATVIYSIFAEATTAQIIPEVAPLATEPYVQSAADKFIGTDLENMLKSRGIKTVIVVGTGAEGAVLYTASHAAFLGLNVVVPVDGMSSTTAYPEQYVAWHLVNAPGVSAKLKETSIGMLTF